MNETFDAELALFHTLREAPPLPPWKAFPGAHRYDMLWGMGAGEEHIYHLYVYFKHCSPEERSAYERLHPEPADWNGWYIEGDE